MKIAKGVDGGITMKVYLVSDYPSTEAVFSSEKKAKAYAERRLKELEPMFGYYPIGHLQVEAFEVNEKG